jgi:hypothetical protein
VYRPGLWRAALKEVLDFYEPGHRIRLRHYHHQGQVPNWPILLKNSWIDLSVSFSPIVNFLLCLGYLPDIPDHALMNL